jgi:hypothetical protein
VLTSPFRLQLGAIWWLVFRWKDAVTWSPYKTMESCYKEFVCVENAQVRFLTFDLEQHEIYPRMSWGSPIRK